MVLWVMAMCSWVDMYHCFAGICSVFIKGKNRKFLRHVGNHLSNFQETSAAVVAFAAFRGLYSGKRLIGNHARSNSDALLCHVYVCDYRRGVD
jgi:hypothetical protein